jgi:hypothetical protein
MRRVPAQLRRLVLRRSGSRCEYCLLSQAGQEATFHVDHVTPVAAGGETVADNLALACVSCSLRKGAKQTAFDPETKTEVPLFNPRRDVWADHFQWDGVRLTGLSPTGRATVEALALNRPLVLAIRREELALGRHPV